MSTSSPATGPGSPVVSSLTPEQTRALFDILSHRETYSEIENFKNSDAVTSYGYPFSRETVIPPPGRSGGSTPLVAATPRSRTPVPPEDKSTADTSGSIAGLSAGVEKTALEDDGGEEEQVSTSPVLQTLFTRFLLTLPWMRDLPQDFWSVRLQGLLSRFAEAELSESYDKGALGLRKTLATGASALLEMLGRGALGRVKKSADESTKEGEEYDLGRAEDLERAWDDAIQGLVYGDLVEEACNHMVETEDLEAHSPTIKGAAFYSLYQYAPRLLSIYKLLRGLLLIHTSQSGHIPPPHLRHLPRRPIPPPTPPKRP